MAENKKSFLLYADLIHTVKKMPKDKAGELLLTILQYVNDEDPEPEDMIVSIVFEPIKQQMKRDLQKWDVIKTKRSEAGKASVESKKIAKQKAVKSIKPQQIQQVLTSVEQPQQSSTNSTVTVNDTVNVTVINKEVVVEVNQESEIFEKTEEVEILKFSDEDVFIDEEEKSAAVQFLKSCRMWQTIQMQQKLEPVEVLKLFDIFYLQKLGFNELKGKSRDDVVKNFYYWIPKYKNGINQNTTPIQKANGNANFIPGRSAGKVTSADATRAERDQLINRLRPLLQGTAPEQRN